MGKGDKKTKRGKIFAKSYGKFRLKSKALRKLRRENKQTTGSAKKEE